MAKRAGSQVCAATDVPAALAAGPCHERGAEGSPQGGRTPEQIQIRYGSSLLAKGFAQTRARDRPNPSDPFRESREDATPGSRQAAVGAGSGTGIPAPLLPGDSLPGLHGVCHLWCVE